MVEILQKKLKGLDAQYVGLGRVQQMTTRPLGFLKNVGPPPGRLPPQPGAPSPSPPTPLTSPQICRLGGKFDSGAGGCWLEDLWIPWGQAGMFWGTQDQARGFCRALLLSKMVFLRGSIEHRWTSLGVC